MSSSSNSSLQVSDNDLENVSESLDFEENLDPVATEEEARAFNESVAREREQEEEALRRFDRTTDINVWCKCYHCSLEAVVDPRECLCCTEFDRCMAKLDDLADDPPPRCITEHPGFASACLDRWVLEVAAMNFKTTNGRRYTKLLAEQRVDQNEFFRAVSYRQFVRLVWESIGRSNRLPLPCCVYTAIRKAYPSDGNEFRGYESGESDDDGDEDEEQGA